MIFKLVPIDERKDLSPKSELIELLNTEFILPDGTVLDDEYSVNRPRKDIDGGTQMIVNNHMTTFIANHVPSYHSPVKDDRMYRYTDFPGINTDESFSEEYIQLTDLRRFSLSKIDLYDSVKDTNYLDVNTSYSYPINFTNHKIIQRQREVSYYDHPFYTENYTAEYIQSMKTFKTPPIFHIYTGEEKVIDYRDAGVLINHGPPGFWSNENFDTVSVADARDNNQIFKSVDERIIFDSPPT
jgi:hypothetical protein